MNSRMAYSYDHCELTGGKLFSTADLDSSRSGRFSTDLGMRLHLLFAMPAVWTLFEARERITFPVTLPLPCFSTSNRPQTQNPASVAGQRKLCSNPRSDLCFLNILRTGRLPLAIRNAFLSGICTGKSPCDRV
jgi:hypothetical protein